MVSCYFPARLFFDIKPELIACGAATVANNEVDESLFISINSNPYPLCWQVRHFSNSGLVSQIV